MKHIKNILFILVLFLNYPECYAIGNAGDIQPNDNFIISFVNASNGEIKIGGTFKRKGDSFLAKSPIQWKQEMDYICARNIRTKRPYKISAKTYNKASATSLNDFIRKKYTCDKGANESYYAISKYLNRYPWDIINDEVAIPIPLPLDDKHLIIISSIPGSNKAFYPDYDPEKREIYITKQMLLNNGIDISELENIRFHVEYQVDDTVHGITDDLLLLYFPNE